MGSKGVDMSDLVPSIIKKGREIGKVGENHLFIWSPCVDCGKKRWVSFEVKTKMPRFQGIA